jgi:penicillin-binding protein 1A
METDAPVYQGRITARTALEQSKISATVRFSDQVGLQRIIDTANRMGLPLQRAELLRRVAIGFEEVSLKQLMRSMAVFATGGSLPQAELFYIDRIENASGLTVFRRKHGTATSTPVLDPAASWQVHSMMAGSLYRGSSRGVLSKLEEKPFHGAGKGGTTHDFSDAWFVGYNRRITCGVWTGFLQSNGGPIYPGAFSRDLAMPVWLAAMNAAAPSFGGGEPLKPPSTIVETPVCTVSGQRATRFCQEYAQDPESGVVKTHSCAMNEFFRTGTEKLAFCSVHSGAGSLAAHPESSPTAALPAIDTAPVRPKAAVLIGDDPYHTEMPVFSNTATQPGLVRRRSNVLDSLDLGTIEESIQLRRPKRLVIEDD